MEWVWKGFCLFMSAFSMVQVTDTDGSSYVGVWKKYARHGLGKVCVSVNLCVLMLCCGLILMGALCEECGMMVSHKVHTCS